MLNSKVAGNAERGEDTWAVWYCAWLLCRTAVYDTRL